MPNSITLLKRTLRVMFVLLIASNSRAGGLTPPEISNVPVVINTPAAFPAIPTPTGSKVALIVNAGQEFDDQVRTTYWALYDRGYNIRLLSYRGGTDTPLITQDLMTRMLRSAEPGDTVVFSLHAHGINEDARNPRLGSREVRWDQHSVELNTDSLRTNEIKEFVEHHKAPGVNVVVMSWSCSGGSAVLGFENNPEVCAISGTSHIGPGTTGEPAGATIRNPKNLTFLDAANQAERWFLSTPGASDRIHQRQYTSGCSQESQHFRNAIAVANVAYGDWELQLSPYNAWIYPDRKPINERSVDEVRNLASQRILQLSVEYYDHYRRYLEARVKSPDFVASYKKNALRILNEYRQLKLSPRFLAGLNSPTDLVKTLDEIIGEAARRFQELDGLLLEISRIARKHRGKAPTNGPDFAYFQALREAIVGLRAQMLQFNTAANPLLNLFEEIDCASKKTACSKFRI